MVGNIVPGELKVLCCDVGSLANAGKVTQLLLEGDVYTDSHVFILVCPSP